LKKNPWFIRKLGQEEKRRLIDPGGGESLIRTAKKKNTGGSAKGKEGNGSTKMKLFLLGRRGLNERKPDWRKATISRGLEKKGGKRETKKKGLGCFGKDSYASLVNP